MQTTPDTTHRRRLRVSLRALLLVIAVVGLCLGWYANKVYRQRTTAAFIKANGGVVAYDWFLAYNQSSAFGARMREPPGPGWLRRVIGDGLFQEIELISLSNVDHPRHHDSLESVLDRTKRGAPQLRVLTVRRSDLNERAYRAIGRLSGLETLQLYDENLTDAEISYLTTLTGLRHVEIVSGGDLTDRALEQLSRLPNLETLSISEISLSDRGLEHLSRIKSLKYLSVWAERSNVSAVGLQRLRAIQSLDVLTLKTANWHIKTRGSRFRRPTPARAIDRAIAELGER
jgi:hypothetical protein